MGGSYQRGWESAGDDAMSQFGTQATVLSRLKTVREKYIDKSGGNSLLIRIVPVDINAATPFPTAFTLVPKALVVD